MKRKPHTPNPEPSLSGQPGSANHQPRSRKQWLVGLALPAVGVAVWLALDWRASQERAHQPDLSQGAANTSSTRFGAGFQTAATSRPPGTAQDKGKADRINRANRLLADGKTDEAVAMLTEAERMWPEDEDVHYNLGIALVRQGKNEEAVKQYEEALRIYPEYAEVHNNLGNLLLRMGRGIQALQHFERAVKITPNYASAWNNFGTALRQLGYTNEAAGYFKEAVRLDTNYWQARFNLGTAYAEQGRLAEARDQFEAVLRLQPGFAPAQAELKRLDEHQGVTPAVRPLP